MLPPSASAPPAELYIPLPVPGPIRALSHTLGLTTLPAHWHVLLGSALLCQLLMYLSSQLSPLIAPLTYPRLPKLKRLDWDVHVVSSVHAVAIVCLVWPNLSDPVLLADRVFGYTHSAGTAYAVSCGYFLWDSIFSLVHVREFGVGFLVHGVACLSVYLFSFRPFLLYFGSIFLLYELSTPFLNAHWFMDKTGWAGTKLQLANGLVFLTTFFTVRIALGFYSSYQFFVSMVHVFDRIPLALFVLYSVANVVLNSLNVYWFMAMIRGLQRRFKSPKPIRASPLPSPKKDDFKEKHVKDMMRESSLVVEVTEE